MVLEYTYINFLLDFSPSAFEFIVPQACLPTKVDRCLRDLKFGRFLRLTQLPVHPSFENEDPLQNEMFKKCSRQMRSATTEVVHLRQRVQRAHFRLQIIISIVFSVQTQHCLCPLLRDSLRTSTFGAIFGHGSRDCSCCKHGRSACP